MTENTGEHQHLCLIGLYYHTDESELVSYSRLLTIHDYDYELIKKFKDDPIYGRMLRSCGVYRLEDYFDKRKSVNMKRFSYCPECGKKIDWKKLKEKSAEDEVY